ncbi:response regulator transcription factor [Marixanthomonas spongiae]|uniref:DNA-binding response regulator n=1 Tax=Marixanthomonas spongiae TaxID=2174845 RepID=A0A2U0HUB3_9FLAO|nr:response regulator transcription factor [Marixanthomonas spongiae]PVW12426.1 DNA-binding response regulator [Marixanthomonas spongiae]
MKILIVEDEQDMLENIQESLEKEAYVVETASNYVQARDKIGVYSYDCILLDIGLPDGNGLDLLKETKKLGLRDSVIIVSAKDALDDKLQGLKLGADDYLPKPFHMAELNARIKAIVRRNQFEGKSDVEMGNLAVNPETRRVTIDTTEIDLNRKKFDVLLYLVSNKNRLVRKAALAEHVWGDRIDQADSFDFIYSQIKNLRKKLETNNADITIKSVYEMGYKLEVV